jgi:type I restriction enzyme, S subunit
MDIVSMTDSELINYCKDNNITFLSKAKKVYTRKTLLRNIKVFNMDNVEVNTDIIGVIEEPMRINKVVWKLEQDTDINQNYKQIRDNLCNIVKKCHQLLYSNNSIVGTKAQNDIMKLLTLKILQPQFANKDSALYKKCEQLLENGKMSKEDYDDGMSYCLDLNVLKNISGNGKNPLNEWKSFIGYFLKEVMPSIYDINDNTFNFDDEKTFMDLIKIINELDIDNEFVDAFSTSYGDIHEAFRVYGGGKGAKELGQFFTPRHLIHAIINGCGFNDIIKSHENPTIYDPCMGTGGLLTRAFSNGNILPNNIYGCETEKDTIKFGECSILLTTNEFNNNIEKCDSLCNNPNIFTNKFNIIFTNPPFGTKMNYDELKKKFNEYKEANFKDSVVRFESVYPHKSNNGACLFIQHCMYMLEKNGTCAIVLPDGELFSGKSFSKFRKFMCDNVDIIKIINVEGGAFEHTSIKISVIIFQKNGLTKNIEFMEIPKECNQVKSSVVVNINNIRSENYTFSLSNYIKKEREVNAKFEVKKLGDVCEFQNGKGLNKGSFIEGEYYVIGGGQKPIGNHNQYNTEENVILCSSSGAYSGFISKYEKKVWKSDCFSIIPDNNILNNTYLYYYLKDIQTDIYNFQKGNAQPHVYSTDLINLEIPIPPLEVQEKIVKDIEQITESIDTIKLRIKQLKDEAKIFMKYYRKSELDALNNDAEVKKLGDVCDIKYGTRIVKKDITKGEYPCYGGGDISFYINEYNREGFNILISRFALSEKCVRLLNTKFYLNDSGLTIKSNDDSNLLNKYIAYYLSNNQDIIYNIARGTAQKNLDMEKFKDIEVPIPPLEVQEEIISIYKENEEMYKIRFMDKIEADKKHIELLNDVSKGIFNQ